METSYPTLARFEECYDPDCRREDLWGGGILNLGRIFSSSRIRYPWKIDSGARRRDWRDYEYLEGRMGGPCQG